MSEGFVYFIQEEETGNIKIGFTEKHPKGRLNDFQTGNSNKLILLGYIDGKFQDESNLHKEFSQERIRRGTEWFKSSPRLKDRIEKLLEKSLEDKKKGFKFVSKKTINFKNGDKYEGECKDGKPHGQGTLTRSNGERYEGEWKDGEPHGQGLGTIKFPDGSRYIGRIKDGYPNGNGRITYSNGSKYSGEWKNGLKHGHGKSTLSGGNGYIEGEFKEDKWWNVTGFDKNGNITGNFVNGVELK